VTSKLQVTIPKAIADRYSISPGDELEWLPGADSVRIVPAKAPKQASTSASRLRLFDAAMKRQREREALASHKPLSGNRGWTREELYERGSSR
jgi:bifunctional DNA-binding transcriptional regulator/antitoxin component of YhaV-PrlF toxin-antitoxin module